MAMFIVESFNESAKTPCKLLPTLGIINFKGRIPFRLVVKYHSWKRKISHLIQKKFTSHQKHLEGGLRSTLWGSPLLYLLLEILTMFNEVFI
jgi:hypothetical protein